MRRRSFTLVESMLAIAIAAILTAAALSGLRGVQSWRGAAAARRVQSDLLCARQTAMLSTRRTLCVFDLGAMTYEVQQESTPGSGAIVATVMDDPLTSAPWRVNLSGLATNLGVSFNPTLNPATFGFDAAGLPVTGAGSALGSDLVLTLTSGATLTVRAGSGLCEVTWP
jgi:prepilin-type N-terminal cleavage/methylation domain-containing protein